MGWSLVASPAGELAGSVLDSVSAVSATDVWAVGHAGSQTLIENLADSIKVHNRLLRPLMATTQPQTPPELRQALRVIDQHVDASITRARLGACGPGYRREVSSVTMSAADCGCLARATLCPAHIESASISPVVPAIGGAGS